MKPAPFEYHQPDSVSEAVSLMVDLEGAELLAGNLSLGVALNNRLATPDHLVDLGGVDDLSFIRETDGGIEVGAMTTHRELERSSALRERLPLLSASAGKIAGPSVRNVGTFGGSIAEADPAGNYPAVVTALEGTLTLRSPDGTREVPAEDFFLAYMFTELREDELIERGTIPTDPYPPDRTGMAYDDLKPVPYTWPKLSAAGVVRVADPAADEPTVDLARLSLGNADDVPLRVPEAEAAVTGAPITEETLDAAAEAAMDAAKPSDELQADAEYKEAQVGVFTRRVLETAYERARDAPR
jgi:carbon-monoxide dehydrogenase medium subunit